MVAHRTLILMRHAAAAGGARDEDRPLTADGEQAAIAAGDWIRATLPPVDAVLLFGRCPDPTNVGRVGD